MCQGAQCNGYGQPLECAICGGLTSVGLPWIHVCLPVRFARCGFACGACQLAARRAGVEMGPEGEPYTTKKMLRLMAAEKLKQRATEAQKEQGAP